MDIPNTDTGYVPLVVRPLLAYAIQKVLPAVYDDSLSYYEVLAKVQQKLDEVVASLANLNDWQEAQDAVMTQLVQMVEDFINGGYRDDFDQFAQAWLRANVEEALALGSHMVFFGLTDDGYFEATIPQKWAMVFGTIVDYDDPNFGSLTITY
jgi:hypothetical protein